MIGNSFYTLSIQNLWRYDKIIHFSEYFVLGLLLFYVLYESPHTLRKMIYYIIFISIIPIVDESIQYFIPTRISSIYDAMADYLGCYSGCTAYYLLNRAFYG